MVPRSPGRRQGAVEVKMSIADKLVLQRQHHLKWRSFDRLELILMIVCGVLCFGFSLSVTCRHRHADHRPSLAVAAGSHLDALHLRHLHRRRRRHRRNDHLYLTAVSEAMHGTPRLIVEIMIRSWCSAVAGVPDLVRLHQLSPGLRQFPAAVEHADRLALCRDPAVRRPDRAVHRRAARQRHPQRL